jgi:hypothetical protein
MVRPIKYKTEEERIEAMRLYHEKYYIEHKPKKTVYCNVCDRYYVNKSALKTHLATKKHEVNMLKAMNFYDSDDEELKFYK